MIKFNRWIFFFLVIFSHLGAILFVIEASTIQLAAGGVVFLILCSFSSTAIYHRLLSHRSWNAPKWVEYFGTILGVFSFTGTPITRTLSHRYHHRFTETELDPHSPQILSLLVTYFPMLYGERAMDIRYVHDLIKDPFHTWVHRHYIDIILVTILISYYFLGGIWTLAFFVFPGALNWANISTCNILCHLGKKEKIVNNKFLALITFGEGFHKNHHNDPENPDFSKEKSIFDLGYFWIRLLQSKKNP